MQKIRQGDLGGLNGDVGDKTQPPMVDSDDGHVERCEVAGCPEHGAVTAHDNGEAGLLSNLWKRYRRVLSDPSVPGSVCFDEDLATVLTEQGRERTQRGVQARVLISADKRDGGKVHASPNRRKTNRL